MPDSSEGYILNFYSCFKFEDKNVNCVSADFSTDESSILFGLEGKKALQFSLMYILKKTDKN